MKRGNHLFVALWTPAIALTMAGCQSIAVGPERSVNLSGQWRFALDREDVGVERSWYNRQLPESIRLPGSLQGRGYGDDVSVETEWTGQIVDSSWYTAARYEKYRKPGNIQIPFWLQPEKHYTGVAWYQKDFIVPASWDSKRAVLELERCHWETQVWLDGRPVGSNNSLSVPHAYELSPGIEPGKHRLTVRVDNRILVPIGINAHSVSDHTQTNWNGITGRISLSPTDPVWIDDLQVFPDPAEKSAQVRVTIGNNTRGVRRCRVTINAAIDQGSKHRGLERSYTIHSPKGFETFEFDYSLGEKIHLWDEFSPDLYRLRATVHARQYKSDKEVRFGIREIGRRGTQLTINGRAVFLRGTLECCIFPLTGYPPMDRASWERIIRICKAHGLNHMRFHSWCPPEAAFDAADRLGFYLQAECAAWSQHVGDDPGLNEFVYAESDRILKAYGNHPSFLMLTYGNEPSGENGDAFLSDLVSYWKKKDPRRIYSGAAGWPILPENQYHNLPAPRIQLWGAGLNSRINAKAPETTTDYRDIIQSHDVPVIGHEIGQWCVYPNFDEIAKYTGFLKPKNFEIFRDTLAANHMSDRARDFLSASGKLQALCYKEEVESTRRTPGYAGFQLLDLHDFPGQGTAPIGVLDPFWDSKGYVSANEFRRFCGDTVPLARLAKRIWTDGELFSAGVEVSHFGPEDLTSAVTRWSIADESGTVAGEGSFEKQIISTGENTALGTVRLPLNGIRRAKKLNLTVSVTDNTAAPIAENDWEFWVYPKAVNVAAPQDVLVSDSFNERVLAALGGGGRAVVFAEPDTVAGDSYGRIPAGFSSIFWNTAWTKRQAPHTLGILCDPGHPALAAFPTEYHSNWQWWELVTKAHPFILDDMPPELRPVVQVIDDWFTNRRLGYLVEASVAGGRLLLCSIDLETDLSERHVARQFRYSVLRYARSDAFDPKVELSPNQVRSLFISPVGNAGR